MPNLQTYRKDKVLLKNKKWNEKSNCENEESKVFDLGSANFRFIFF